MLSGRHEQRSGFFYDNLGVFVAYKVVTEGLVIGVASERANLRMSTRPLGFTPKYRPRVAVITGLPCPTGPLGSGMPRRSGGRLAACVWLGQGFHQRPDLGVGGASGPAQGTEVGQPALLRPATHRLWGHMKEPGDLRCTQVPRLGWLRHHALHSFDCPPDGGQPYAHRKRLPSSVLHSEPAAG